LKFFPSPRFVEVLSETPPANLCGVGFIHSSGQRFPDRGTRGRHSRYSGVPRPNVFFSISSKMHFHNVIKP